MIETSLVYIGPNSRPFQFVGCGAIVEGGFIATCRHVWRDAGGTDAKGGAVTVVFPRSRDEAGDLIASSARLVDACDDGKPGAPDLVLLRVERLPLAAMMLQIARAEALECGEGFAHAFLPTKDIDARIRGVIDDLIDAKGRRRFRDGDSNQYWFESGSSGSPMFLKAGQQLAGLVSLSELGKSPHTGPLREAFIVRGLTVWTYLSRLLAQPIADRERVDVSKFRDMLAQLGHDNVPASEIPAKLEAALAEMRARSQVPVVPSNAGVDIDEAITAARAKLGMRDQPAALEIIKAKLAEASEARKDATKREVALLREQAAIERLAYDHEAAKMTLRRLLELDADQVWRWIDLGDIFVTTGASAEALGAFRSAGEAARRAGKQRDLSVSYNRIGDVLFAQGNLPEALASYRADLAIAERLARADADNAGWQRDLSVSHSKIGNVAIEQGNLPEALTSYRASLAIAEKLAKADVGNAGWQRDLSVSYHKIGDVLIEQGKLPEALISFRAGHAIREKLAKADADNAGWQRDLSLSYSKIGDVLIEQGNLPEALTSFRASLDIAEKLAKADAGNAGWQRDLSVSYEKIGNVQVEQGKLPEALTSFRASLAIAEKLAKADVGNAGWQRDLSVSYDRFGGVLVAQGNFPEALTSFRASLAIREMLAKADAGNARWQRDLSVSYHKIGVVLVEQGKLPEALTSARDLAISFGRVARISARQGAEAEALRGFGAGRAIIEKLQKISPDRADLPEDLAWFDGEIASLRKASDG